MGVLCSGCGTTYAFAAYTIRSIISHALGIDRMWPSFCHLVTVFWDLEPRYEFGKDAERLFREQGASKWFEG